MRIVYTLLALLLLLQPATAEWAEFPADKSGLTVVDRDAETVYSNSGEAQFYAVLYNGNDQSFLYVYKGLPWKQIHRWPVTFQGEKVKVRDRAVLKLSHDEEDQKFHIFWRDYAGYAEAAVHQVLIYDRKTGKFSTKWSD